MWTFHIVYVYQDLSAFTRGLPQFFAIVVALLGTASVYLAVFMRPLDRCLARLERGEPVTDDERLGARRIISRLPIVMLVVSGVGFVLGPLMQNIAVSLVSGSAILWVPLGLTIFYNLGIGLVAALEEIHLINLSLHKPIEALQLHHYRDDIHDFGSSAKTVLTGGASVLLAAALMLSATYAGFTNTAERPLIVAEKLQAGDSLTETESAALEAYASIAAGEAVSEQSLVALRRTVAAEKTAFLVRTGLLAVLVIALLLLPLLTNTRERRRQIVSINETMEDIASGTETLDRRLNVIQFDEVGRLVHTVNRLIERLQTLVATIVRATGRVSGSSEHLENSAGGAAASVRQLQEAVTRVQENAGDQTEVVQRVSGVIESMLQSIEEVSNQVTIQASYVEESSAAVNEMAASINSVTQITEQADKLATRLLGVASDGSKVVFDAVKAIRELEDSSKSVSNIVTVISDIAAQTNLLAMNAAIEAAHAGESGRGFAVVADEVRNLAEDSAKRAKEISGLVRSMTDRISSGVELTETAGQAFEHISADIKATSELVKTISSAMEEQKAGTDEILRSTESLVQATGDIKNLAGRQRDGGEEMRESLESLVSAAGRIKQAVMEQTKGNEEIVRIVNEVSAVSAENVTVVHDLDEIIRGYDLGNGRNRESVQPRQAATADGSNRQQTD
jgi:methyl-accepting chemotaxis protein